MSYACSKRAFRNFIALSAILAVIVPFWDVGQSYIKNYSYRETHHEFSASSQDVVLEADSGMDVEDSQGHLKAFHCDVSGFISIADLSSDILFGVIQDLNKQGSRQEFSPSRLAKQNRLGLPPPHLEFG